MIRQPNDLTGLDASFTDSVDEVATEEETDVSLGRREAVSGEPLYP